MTHNSTRKQFVAKLLGVVAATSVFSRLFAKSASSATATSTPGGSKPPRSFEIRHDTRVVARRDPV